MTATDDMTCHWCYDDAPEEPELVGHLVTAESGPDGWPLYRCAACGAKAHAPEPRAAFSQELVAAIAWSLSADVLRQAIAEALGRAER